MGRENTRDSRTRKSSTAQRAHRLRGPAARKRMPVRGDKQEPGLPERAANGQAGAEPVSRRSPYCWCLRPWQAGAYLYVDSLIDRSDLGSFDDVSSPVSTDAEPSIVPPDFAGVRNLLVLGLDYEAEGPVARDEKHPNTDMILYVRLDGNARCWCYRGNESF